MARLIFSIQGDRVQNIGYRLFLLSAMKERGLLGYPTNLYTGKQVNIIVWGDRKKLADFYNHLKTTKLAGAGKIEFSPTIIDNGPKISTNALLNEKMDLMIEQTGKFVQEARTMPKRIGKEFRNALEDKVLLVAEKTKK